MYRTRKSWSVERRVVGKAEHLSKGPNPRFIVTNIPATERASRALYEQDYCGRGEMENRIKEQQLCLFADRTKLLKIGAAVTVTVRKVWVQLASACPSRKVFAHVWQNLRDWAPHLGSLPPSESLPPPGNTAPPLVVETS